MHVDDKANKKHILVMKSHNSKHKEFNRNSTDSYYHKSKV